ncbi:hypothetical protein DFJ73DRAFT_827331 [Zopfochytrium polystomum]|nr:hypothetical protein DFJ73DRAFT_827331 [Zopfochytrium polystomum]
MLLACREVRASASFACVAMVGIFVTFVSLFIEAWIMTTYVFVNPSSLTTTRILAVACTSVAVLFQATVVVFSVHVHVDLRAAEYDNVSMGESFWMWAAALGLNLLVALSILVS